MRRACLALRLLLGGLFLYASWDKILHPAAFASIVRDYRILPDALSNAVAISLPWLEAVLGALLILGRLMPGALALTNLLLLGFYAALVANAIRGVDIGCGCFSTAATAGDGGTAWYLFRDGLFLILAWAAAWTYGRTQRTAPEASATG